MNTAEEMIAAIKTMTSNLGVTIDFSQIDRKQFNKGRPLTFGEVRKIAEAKSLVYGVFLDRENGGRARHGIWEAELLHVGHPTYHPSLMLSQGSFGLDMELAEFGADGDIFKNDNEYYLMELFEPRLKKKVTEPKPKRK